MRRKYQQLQKEASFFLCHSKEVVYCIITHYSGVFIHSCFRMLLWVSFFFPIPIAMYQHDDNNNNSLVGRKNVFIYFLYLLVVVVALVKINNVYV
mmetsp:Transcript_44267/g.72663  ORF Transcript_44267/g.72663 Transcript_44267/m.72663 type:complete len:95 (+) Transcript_44267:291-575(+)